MSLEVTFSPIQRITVQDEGGVVTQDKNFPPLFRPVALPDCYWIRYENSQYLFPLNEREIKVVDPNGPKTVWVESHDIPFWSLQYMCYTQPNHIIPQADVEKKFVELSERYRMTLEKLQRQFTKTKLAVLEPFALQIATICTFVSKEKFFKFSLHKSKIPVSHCSISPGGDIFLDVPKNRIGEGGTRTFKEVIWLNRQIRVAKGEIFFSLNSSRVAHESQALSELNGLEGIITTYSQGLLPCGIGNYFLVFQELHQADLHRWLYRQKWPLSIEDKIDLVEQLLKGLVRISEKGVHFDIQFANILVSRLGGGKIKGVITDFGLFVPYSSLEEGVPASDEYCPPEFHQEQLISSKLDVWMLGLVFYRLFVGWPPCWCKGGPMIETICQLKANWPLSELMGAPEPIRELINWMLMPDPSLRPTAGQALDDYLDSIRNV